MAVGQLVVKVGLDAAEYTKGLTKADKDAYDFGQSIGSSIRTGALAAVSALGALGLSAGAALAALSKQAEQIAGFQQLSEKIGDTASNVQSLKLASDVSGVSLDTVATISAKLTATLSKTSDESKNAGKAIAALGLNLNDFKKLSPVDQLDAAAKALAGFENNAGKTAVAIALFGKSGAELIPFLNDLAESGRTNIKLTDDQIAAIDQHQKATARLKSEIESLAQLFVVQSVDALTAFTSTLKLSITEVLNLTSGSSDLGGSTGVQVFAEAAGRALAGLIDYVVQTKNEFSALVDFVGSSIEAVKKIGTLDFGGAKQVGADFRARYGLDANGVKAAGEAGTAQGRTYAQKFDDQLASIKRTRFAASDPRRVDGGGSGKPSLAGFSPLAPKRGGGGKVKDTSKQEAKAQLSSDLDAIKNAQNALTDQYANQEKILEALRSAGLKDETQYYGEKQRLLAATSTAQEDALRQQIARMQQENLTGKDAIDNNKKIADAQAKLTKVQEDAATQSQVLGIQQSAAYKRIEGAILSARQAAQDFFDTTNRGYDREIAGIGKGNKSRGLDAGVTQIEDKYRQQRQDLQNQRSQQELAGTFTPDAAKQFDSQLSIINEFQSKALSSYKAYYQSLEDASKDWTKGATEALQNYADESANTAKQMESVVGNAFKGLEDALVEFTTTGKLNFKGLIDSILKDVARMVIKQQITGPLAGLLGGALGGTGGGSDVLGDFLKANGQSGSSGGGSNFLSGLFSLFGKASGGNIAPNSLTRINENGPELVDYKGKQYLANGNANAQVTANNKIGGGGFNQSNTFVVPGRLDLSTQDQLALRVRRQTNTAAARFA